MPIAQGTATAEELERVRSASVERPAATSDTALAAPSPPPRPRWRRWLSMLNPIRKRICPYPGHESFANAPWLVVLGWFIFAVITVAKCVDSSATSLTAAASSPSSSSVSVRTELHECTGGRGLHAHAAVTETPGNEDDRPTVAEHDRERGPIGTVHCLHSQVDGARQQVGLMRSGMSARADARRGRRRCHCG